MTHRTYTTKDGQKIRCLRDGVIVRRDKETKKSALGLIHLPDNAHDTVFGTGEILAFGMFETKSGKKIPLPDFEVGLKCCYVKFHSEAAHNKEIRELEEDVLLLQKRDILFMWHKDEDLPPIR